jgi:hypothetical protein
MRPGSVAHKHFWAVENGEFFFYFFLFFCVDGKLAVALLVVRGLHKKHFRGTMRSAKRGLPGKGDISPERRILTKANGK